jgi:dienelactone hydrolase
MEDICRSLGEQGVDVFCPDLLCRPAFDYVKEHEAYRYFMDNVGFLHAKHKVEDLIDDVWVAYEKVVIVGFSVGATVAWLCSEDERIDGVVGYYGSRIRQFSELQPRCPVLLVFPRKEPSFDVAELLLSLQKRNVRYLQFEGEHGFSDPYSDRFDEMSAQEAFREMSRFIREI